MVCLFDMLIVCLSLFVACYSFVTTPFRVELEERRARTECDAAEGNEDLEVYYSGVLCGAIDLSCI